MNKLFCNVTIPSRSSPVRGLISPTLLCKAHMCCYLAFGTIDAFKFHQQNCTLIYKYTELEVMPNQGTLIGGTRTSNWFLNKLGCSRKKNYIT